MFSYIARVRGEVNVWGSADLSVGLSVPLVLVLNNDTFGDIATIATHEPAGAPTVLGVLKPGECWTLTLSGLCAVTADCATDTTLACALIPT